MNLDSIVDPSFEFLRPIFSDTEVPLACDIEKNETMIHEGWFFPKNGIEIETEFFTCNKPNWTDSLYDFRIQIKKFFWSWVSLIGNQYKKLIWW